MNGVWNVEIDLTPPANRLGAVKHAAALALMEAAIKYDVNLTTIDISFNVMPQATSVKVPANSKEEAIEAARRCYSDRTVTVLKAEPC